MIQSYKEQMVEICKEAFQNGLFAGTSGNLSVYLPEAERMLITPSGVRYRTMQAEDIMEVTLHGEVLGGRGGKPSSEWRMHSAVYRQMPQVGAIFHTHSPYATAFAVNRAPIPPVLIEMQIFLGGEIGCAPFAQPGTEEVGTYALPLLEGKGGCLLANHGVLAIGKDLSEAFLRAEYIEDGAKICCIAKSMGEPVVLP